MAKHHSNLNPKASDRAVKVVQRAPSAEALTILASLQAAVRTCLRRKQRLGQCAVIWKDGAPRLLNPTAMEPTA
ncbi:MAG: hypothetical protein ACK53K_09255 [Burkholderiales bacterium]